MKCYVLHASGNLKTSIITFTWQLPSRGSLAEAHILITYSQINHKSHQDTHDGCLGQVRGRAPASAAIRFELVVHVQARDRWEKGALGGPESSSV